MVVREGRLVATRHNAEVVLALGHGSCQFEGVLFASNYLLLVVEFGDAHAVFRQDKVRHFAKG